MTPPKNRKTKVLLTGATGYIGGRLLKPLEEAGYALRCMARRPQHLEPRVAATTEIIQGDVFDVDSLRAAMTGIDIAYYLVHSLGNKKGWQAMDRQAARNFSNVAREMGVKRIIYLGGLGEDLALSEHLSSRQEVGEILRHSGVLTIELRASIVIGSESLSFEMIRALVNRLPVMLMPKWIRQKAQPIAIEDVVEYLLQSIDLKLEGSDHFEIGGADQVSYLEIMKEYAAQRGMRRYFIPVPVLTPHLSSLWLGLVTPLYARVGRKLIESVVHDTVVHDKRALTVFDIQPRGMKEAIARALINEDREIAMTRWSDAMSTQGAQPNWGGVKFGSRNIDSRTAQVAASPSTAFAPIRRLGGDTGWYYANFLWRLRGFLDLLAGGVGMRRGRRDPDNLQVGDVVDFWRVEAFEPDRLLRFSAEMKMPGRAWLQYEVDDKYGGSTIRQTAIFDPVGLSGLLYWYLLFPLHKLIFAGMLRGIVYRAEKR